MLLNFCYISVILCLKEIITTTMIAICVFNYKYIEKKYGGKNMQIINYILMNLKKFLRGKCF